MTTITITLAIIAIIALTLIAIGLALSTRKAARADGFAKSTNGRSYTRYAHKLDHFGE